MKPLPQSQRSVGPRSSIKTELVLGNCSFLLLEHAGMLRAGRISMATDTETAAAAISASQAFAYRKQFASRSPPSWGARPPASRGPVAGAGINKSMYDRVWHPCRMRVVVSPLRGTAGALHRLFTRCTLRPLAGSEGPGGETSRLAFGCAARIFERIHPIRLEAYTHSETQLRNKKTRKN